MEASMDSQRYTAGNDTPAQQLEDFLAVIETDCVNPLDKWLNGFNVFDVLRIVRTEIRHSNVLAWLLDPNENHGRGSGILKGFLSYACTNCDSFTLSDLEDLNLFDFSVYREWKNIDLLIISKAHRIAIVVENKIDSDEHGDQLRNYYDLTKDEFSHDPAGPWQIAYLFLSPNRREPSLPDIWCSMGYEDVLAIIESASLDETTSHTDQKELIGQNLLIENYKEVIRRDLLDNKELTEKCREIYQKHHAVLDLIFNNIPDRNTWLYETFCAWAQNGSDEGSISFDEKHSSKSYVRFTLPSLDGVFPKEPTHPSAWNSSTHYYVEIENGKKNETPCFRMKFTFGRSKNTPYDLLERFERFEDCSGGKRQKDTWTYRTYFPTNWFLVDESVNENDVIRELNRMFQEVTNNITKTIEECHFEN